MDSHQQSNFTRTLITLDSELVDELQSTLAVVKLELLKLAERERQAKIVNDDNRLLNEAEAMEYLRRDSDTLQYYRKRGLESYKRGQYRWYRKGDIDAWLEEGKVKRRIV